MVQEMNTDPRMIGQPLESDPPDVAIARIASASRATYEAIAGWARGEVEFQGGADETEVERNNRVARNNAVLKTLGEWQDRSMRAADTQAKLAIATVKTSIATEHLSLAKLGQLRAIASDPEAAEAAAVLARAARKTIEDGEDV